MTSVRKTLHPLQKAAGDKENLVGPGRMVQTSDDLKAPLREVTENDNAADSQCKSKKNKKSCSKSVQVGPTKSKDSSSVTVSDLTSTGAPSEKYWEVLAERRRVALEHALAENEELHSRIAKLEEENEIQKATIEESQTLVDILKEMVGGYDTADESGLVDNSYEVP